MLGNQLVNPISTEFQCPLWLVSFLLPALAILGLYAFSSSNKYLRKIEIYVRIKVRICISSYSNVDVVRRYDADSAVISVFASATWRAELNDVHLIVDGS